MTASTHRRCVSIPLTRAPAVQGGFNRDRAQEVASAFRSSLADYELIDASGNLLPPREGTAASADDEVLVLGGNAARLLKVPA